MDDHFDPAAGEAGKAEGMARAEAAADEEWKRVMLECVLEVARRKPFFTTDDAERLRREKHPNVTTHENRAIGPIMREAQALGVCVKTLDWVESQQKVNHRRPMRVWWSNVYEGPKLYRRPRRRKPLDPRQIDFFALVDA